MKVLRKLKLNIGSFSVWASGLYFDSSVSVTELAKMIARENATVEAIITDLDTDITVVVMTFNELAELLLTEDFFCQIIDGDYKFVSPWSDIAVKAFDYIHFCYEIEKYKVMQSFDDAVDLVQLSFCNNTLDRVNLCLADNCKSASYYINICYDYCRQFYLERNHAGVLFETNEKIALGLSNFVDYVLDNQHGVLWKGNILISLRCRHGNTLGETVGVLCYFRFDDKFLKYLLLSQGR